MNKNNIGLDIENLLMKLRGNLARHEKNAAETQQHIDLVKRGQVELFPWEDPKSKAPQGQNKK